MINIYSKISKDIVQGLLFRLSREELDTLFTDVPEEINTFIVLSNSCDLINNSVKYISIAPIVPLSFIVQQVAKQKKEANKDSKSIKSSIDNKIRDMLQYKSKIFFYLPPSKYYKIKEPNVALLDNIRTLDFNQVKTIILKNGVCILKSPWNEKLGWCIGNIYNRIAVKDF